MEMTTLLRSAPQHAVLHLHANGRHLVDGSNNERRQVAVHLVVADVQRQFGLADAADMPEAQSDEVGGNLHRPFPATSRAVWDHTQCLQALVRRVPLEKLLVDAVRRRGAPYEIAQPNGV